MKKYIGKAHANLLDWLSNQWLVAGPPVCFLEGFPGLGKTSLSGELISRAVKATHRVAVSVDMPEEADSLDDLFLRVAGELESAGEHTMARAVDDGGSLELALGARRR